jgi:hypothetical protein
MAAGISLLLAGSELPRLGAGRSARADVGSCQHWTVGQFGPLQFDFDHGQELKPLGLPAGWEPFATTSTGPDQRAGFIVVFGRHCAN